MSELVDKIKIIYEELKQEMMKAEGDDKQYLLNRFERKLVEILVGNKSIQDNEKNELLEFLSQEYNIVKVIESYESDEEKIKRLGQIKDKSLSMIIIKSFKDNRNKIKFLHECKSKNDKCIILLTCEKDLLEEYFKDNSEMKKQMVEFLYTNMSELGIKENEWNIMKELGLENQVIPHILANTKYRILNEMNEEMKQDVEKYLGKPIPQNTDELSEYEKVGIDTEILQGDVITSEAQLGMDDLERSFLRNCKPDENNRKRISIKDFIGTISPTLKYEYEGKVNTWEDLMMGLKRMPENIKHHKESYLFSDDRGDEPIRLQGINGKYFVYGNGNHRMTMLKLRYLTEIERAKNNPERIKEIDEEYQIQVSEAVEVPKDKEEMIAIDLLFEINEIQQNDNKISELIENGQKVGYRIKEKEQERIIKSKEELIEYLELMKQELKRKPNQYDELKKKIKDYEIKEENREALSQMLNIKEEKISEETETEQKPIQKPISLLQMESFSEKQKSTRLEENESINIWMNLFQNCDSKIRKLPNNLKQKFILMKSEITQSIKQVIKIRKQDKEVTNSRAGENINEGRI